MIDSMRDLTSDTPITVDFKGDERDPAWKAFCEDGWCGVWHHADDYALPVHVTGASPDSEPSDEWRRARNAAERAAKEEGEAHRADVHHD